MSDPQSEADALAERARRVGWNVSTTPTGWRVDTGKSVVMLSREDSDLTSKSLRNMLRNGLLDAERHANTVGERVRLNGMEKLFSDQEDREEAEGARYAAALARAAGPYTRPEKVHITWFAQAHPAPWHRWVQMTPEIAQFLITTTNTDNRPVRPRSVQRYKRIILAGKWKLTHQGWAMDTRAILQDGQHRALGLVEAGKENPDIWVPVSFYVGMPVENFAAIDEGLNRTGQDLLAKKGVANPKDVAACVRLVDAYYDDTPRNNIRLKGTNEEIEAAYDKDPEGYNEAAAFGKAHTRKVKSGIAALAAAYYVLRKKNGQDNRYLEAFFGGLVSPQGTKHGTRMVLDDNDPRLAVRSNFANARENRKHVNALDAMCLIIQAWNYTLTGERRRFMKFTSDMAIPRPMMIFDPGDDTAVGSAPAILQHEIRVMIDAEKKAE